MFKKSNANSPVTVHKVLTLSIEFCIVMANTELLKLHTGLINKTEMVQRQAARFCHNDYTSRETGLVSEMIKKLHVEQLTTRRTNRRLTIFHKAIHGHLSLPVGSAIHTSKNC